MILLDSTFALDLTAVMNTLWPESKVTNLICLNFFSLFATRSPKLGTVILVIVRSDYSNINIILLLIAGVRLGRPYDLDGSEARHHLLISNFVEAQKTFRISAISNENFSEVN